MENRNSLVDALKGLAIIAILLYHFGGEYLPFGYLGVDIFFVISGYYLVRQLIGQFEKNEFRYLRFVFQKLVRLWPLVLLLTIIAMFIGYFLMLPNDYENLAESAVASSIFANNILQCITTKNYWDIVNLYKPLMHLWYVGVLMQAYVVLPIIYCIFVKVCRSVRRGFGVASIGITCISIFFWLVPVFSNAWKFYYLPFRLYEITLGGVLSQFSLETMDHYKRLKKIGLLGSVIGLILFLCSRIEIGSSRLMLFCTVVSTMIFLYCSRDYMLNEWEKKIVSIGAFIGKRSYSIYIWHQLIVAFLFYSVFPKQSVLSLIIYISLSTVISLISYKIIEYPLAKKKEKEKIIVSCAAIVAILISAVSFNVYLHAGVVRDVPELQISKNNTSRGMHSQYCDRVYSWDRPFCDDEKTKVLVIGNSFGRDWANILYEYSQDLDISFLFYSDGAIYSHLERIGEAEYVFYALGLSYGEVPTSVVENVNKEKLYVISNKNFGQSNGIIYAHRNAKNYFSQTIEYPALLLKDNTHNAEIWQDHFIDLMTPIENNEGRIRVFTDDNKFISQDCRHLTQAGAQYYARILDLKRLFPKND